MNYDVALEKADRVLAEEDMSVFATLTYDYAKVSNVLDIPETWTPVLTLTTPNRPDGVYEFGMSFTYDFPDTNDSAYVRWRIDGGVWNEFRSEPKDIQDRIAAYYAFPAQYAAGVHVMDFEMRKDVITANQLDLLFLDLWFHRVGP